MIIQGQYHLKSKKWNLNQTFQVKSNASKEMMDEYKECVLSDIEQLICDYLLNRFDVEEYEQIRELIPNKISQIKFTTLK
tara:strand:- start:359 stop:598 length:240 start_codon:yes stop_codon:yes gene_type:complete